MNKALKNADTAVGHRFCVGDHLKVSRTYYNHHGIFIGDDRVIHYSPPDNQRGIDGIGIAQILGANSKINTIHVAGLHSFEFEEGKEAFVVEYDKDQVYPPLKVLARARSRLGENGYNLWGNNCEHFVSWCKQVEDEGHEGGLLSFVRIRGRKGRQDKQLDSDHSLLSQDLCEWLDTFEHAPAVYKQFVHHATKTYFLINRRFPRPFGRYFKHVTEISDYYRQHLPEHRDDSELLFVYQIPALRQRGFRNWYITSRAIDFPDNNLYLDFHEVAAIGWRTNHVVVSSITGGLYEFPVRCTRARDVAEFLAATVSGVTFRYRHANLWVRLWLCLRNQFPKAWRDRNSDRSRR